MKEKRFKHILPAAAALAAVPAWAHPGHGAAGLWHHAGDWAGLLVLAGVVVFAARAIRRRGRR